MTTNTAPDPCPRCQQPMVVPCPCGTPCGVSTPTRRCPHCEPEEVKREQKFRGQQVCQLYVRQQLGTFPGGE